MSSNQSVMMTRRGKFRFIYRELKRRDLLKSTPIILCEGDSWFSTPLSPNMLDWLVNATPDEEARMAPVLGKGGLFFRAEKSGDLAINMFTRKNIKDLAKWYGRFDFDAVLISAGGNDCVDDFLKELFKDDNEMSVAEAREKVRDSGRFDEIHSAYWRFLDRFTSIKPTVPIIGHTYDYPLRLGVPGELTLRNLGVAAVFKKTVGDWISRHIKHVLPDLNDQLEFSKQLIDDFVDRVLKPLDQEFPSFSFVDLRGSLTTKEHWFDEMHPTGEGFHILAKKMRTAVIQKLSEKFDGDSPA